MPVHDLYPALKAHADTAWVYFAIDFKPQIDAVMKLGSVRNRLRKRSKIHRRRSWALLIT